MEYGINKKLKVVWLCHFTNEHIQDILKPRKRMPEMAPWITIGIEEAKKRKDIELHIVAPHRWISGDKELEESGIFYHFFNPGIPFYGRHWPGVFRFDIYTNFWNNKKKVKQFVNKIKPDIIHLHGLENAYYSSTILQFINDYPILATIQGFISLQIPKGKLSSNIKKRLEVEIKLLKKLNNFGVHTNVMIEEIKKFNPNANIYWHEYFTNVPIVNSGSDDENKEYDLIFFARISKAKGVEDLIKATGLLKNNFPNIKVAIIGGTNQEYLKFLVSYAREKKCENNIDFLGFLLEQKDVYKVLQKSKICVLPTYNDTVPGTIVESMFGKIPVVTYKTGGIPEMNKEKEVVLLSKQGDISGLVKNISLLLQYPEKRNLIVDNAYQYAIKRWNNTIMMEDIIKAYKEILKK